MIYEEFKQVSGLHKISQKIDRKKSAGVNSKNYTNGSFTILTDVVKKVMLGNVESYTFLIETPTNEVYFLENFCVEKTSDSIINYFMYHYRWLDTNENGLNFAVEISRVDENLIDVNLISSFTKTITTDECIEVVYSSCDSGGNADGHGPADQGGGTYCSGSDAIGLNVGSCDFGGAGGSNTGDNDNSGTTTTDTDTSTSNTGGGSDSGTETDPNGTAIVCTDNCPDNSDLINFELSQNSPFDVDMSTVLDSINLPASDSTQLANTKFLCVYNKLTTSNTFKNLFIDTFGDGDKFNVTFKVTKNLKHNGERVNGLFSGLSNPLRNTATGEIVSFETQIEIDQDLLTNNSNFNAAKTILHESIHAYFALKLLECNPNFPYNYYDGLELSEMVFLFYDNLCNGTISQHELMFDYMLPTFEEIFTQIGINNLASQDDLTNFVNDPDLNWEDFLFYFSMQGLHNTQVFLDEIQNDPNKLAKFSRYVTASKNLNKECE